MTTTLPELKWKRTLKGHYRKVIQIKVKKRLVTKLSPWLENELLRVSNSLWFYFIVFQFDLSSLPTILDRIFRTKWRSPVKQDRKRKVWHLFLHVFNCYCQRLISWGGNGHWAMCPYKFEIFLILANFLRSIAFFFFFFVWALSPPIVFSRSATREATRTPSLLHYMSSFVLPVVNRNRTKIL